MRIMESPDEIRAKLRTAILKVLPKSHHDVFDELIDGIVKERDEARQDFEWAGEDHASELRCRNEALLTVKHWMHDVLYLGKPMSDPRAVLRTVERALEP